MECWLGRVPGQRLLLPARSPPSPPTLLGQLLLFWGAAFRSHISLPRFPNGRGGKKKGRFVGYKKGDKIGRRGIGIWLTCCCCWPWHWPASVAVRSAFSQESTFSFWAAEIGWAKRDWSIAWGWDEAEMRKSQFLGQNLQHRAQILFTIR